MKRSVLIATLVLALGMAIGCSDGKKTATAPPTAPPGNPPPPEGCPGGTQWDGASCVVIQGQGPLLYSNLNISSNNLWSKFLDDYFFTTGPGYSVCGVGYKNDWLDFYEPFGMNDCETYTQNRTITLYLSNLLISDDSQTSGYLILTASSSYAYGYGSVYQIRLPITSQSVTVGRIAIDDVPDSGFQMQMTIAGRNGPKIFRIRGNSIDLISTNGADVELYYGAPGSIKRMGSASFDFN